MRVLEFKIVVTLHSQFHLTQNRKSRLRMRRVCRNSSSRVRWCSSKISTREKIISLDNLTTFCKTRGFVYEGSSIYGGFAHTFDYGT